MRLKRAVNIRKRFQKSKCKRKKKKKKLNLSLSLFMALLSGTLQLTSNYIPGYGVSDSRSFSNSVVSRRTLAFFWP
ncbi:BnaCnng77450D [Brassica napus]|uniref:BnaC03g17320D protein n=1 Tax=Brassica napus TaxID=3708 RepID=A0A078JXP4_BRANA|nr:BnaC03g17320D [Brassica napus]CDY72403.1 BnaCnng77450D [Brassica napus]